MLFVDQKVTKNVSLDSYAVPNAIEVLNVHSKMESRMYLENRKRFKDTNYVSCIASQRLC